MLSPRPDPAPRYLAVDDVPLEEAVRRPPSQRCERLKALEDDNRRLKRLVADQALSLQILKDVLGNER